MVTLHSRMYVHDAPGELEYQQQLEQTNLEEFKKLLERNGMEYDPNYRRGGF